MHRSHTKERKKSTIILNYQETSNVHSKKCPFSEFFQTKHGKPINLKSLFNYFRFILFTLYFSSLIKAFIGCYFCKINEF